ncbi:MAG: excinuclease ABC subunit UvrC [Chitinophagales bacterium]|nr:excinuclease ABC subunit C [Bacteroidota bacterium]MBK8681495.1 excinuclease ABC subunit C [Bacteroidota bacterium]
MTTDYFKNIEFTLPSNPGVYRYYDKDNQILYVGKAKNLKKRVGSYFRESGLSGRIQVLVKKTSTIEFTITNTEQDAFLLENTLIKKLQPRYNINLKDGKTYPYIVIKKERFPRIFFTRKKIQDGSLYLGPYTSLTRVKTIFDFIKTLFPIRTCSYNLSAANNQAGKFKICLEYHLGNCKGPCENLQSEEEYMENVQQIIYILKGNMGLVKNLFIEKLTNHVEALEFEQAEEIRKKIEIIDQYQNKSSVVNFSITNVDVFAIADAEGFAVISYLKIMQGMITQAKTLEISKKLDETPEELLIYGITELQLEFESEASELILPFAIDLPETAATQYIPQAGEKKKLLDLALKNAMYVKEEKEAGNEKREKKKGNIRVLEAIKNDFRLTQLPYHIECFDNSNIQGTTPVASMVVFRNAMPCKKDYRHFNIKTVVGPDDFSSMQEIVYRRYKRLIDEAIPLPQLIVIDGGKGQLHAATEALKELNIYGQIAICSIAKRLEEIYFPEDSVPLYLSKKSESLKVIQQLRDEAHRFAITFHRQKRSKSALGSELNIIPGIGSFTVSQLIKKYKSVKKIKETKETELAEVIGIARAQLITAYFKNKDDVNKNATL